MADKPFFAIGDKVECTIIVDGKPLPIGTIVRVPKKHGGGFYSYDVDFNGRLQRITEQHLKPASMKAGR